MKSGEEYELFVYEKFKRLYVDADVKHDERIDGKLSGIKVQIDVSIKFNHAGTEYLYVVECKDWKARTDIKVLRQFAGVMEDVGASKGFLLCTSGFAETNHRYASCKGIELFTIEDINSDKWKAQVEIPIIYKRNTVEFKLVERFVVTETDALARVIAESLAIVPSFSAVSLDFGATEIDLGEWIDFHIQKNGFNVASGGSLDMWDPYLCILVLDEWVPIKSLKLEFIVSTTHYLRYVTPDEYDQLSDHVSRTVHPLNVVIKDIPFDITEGAAEIDESEIPVTQGLSVEIDDMPSSFKHGVTLNFDCAQK